MCNPVAAMAVMAAITVVQTSMAQKAARDQAHAQAGMLKEQARQQEQAATEARKIDLEALEQRELEANQASTVNIIERERQAAREEAMIRVAAAEAGLLGNTVDRQLIASTLSASQDVSIIETNLENTQTQLGIERKNVEATYQGRMNAARNTGKQGSVILGAQPSGFMNFLQIVSAGAKGAASGYSMGSDFSKVTSTQAGTTLGNIPYIPAK